MHCLGEIRGGADTVHGRAPFSSSTTLPPRMAAFAAAALLLPALAVAVPSPSASTGAGAGAEESAEALRRLQAAGACNGMMLEMQPIAASCCDCC